MKPLLGQLQNQANLDDLLGSSKSVGGNFGRSGFANGKKADKAGDSSFTDMLLNTINKSASNKQASKPQAPTAAAKIPDQTPRVARPAVKQATPDKHTTSSGHPSDLAESTFKTSSRPAREDSEYYSEASKTEAPNGDTSGEASSDGHVRTTKSSATKSGINAGSAKPQNQSLNGANAEASTTATAEGAMSQIAGVNPAAVAATNQMMPVAPINPENINMLNMQAPLVGGDAKAALAPLKTLMAGTASSEALLNRNAVLAFVTGRLEKLDPESLPGLITDSMLIKQAMASGDVAKFMQTPMAIGELANLLELDQSLINKASTAGLDPNKLVMPKDFINALGLDAGRVTTELSILQQKLPADGIASYVERAKALIANAGKTLNSNNGVASDSKLGKDGAAVLAGQKTPSGSAEKLTGPTTGKLPEEITAPIEIPVPQNLSNQQSINLAGLSQAAQNQNVAIRGNNPVLDQSAISGKLGNLSQSNQRSSFDPADLLAAEALGSGIQISQILSQKTTPTNLVNNSQTETLSDLNSDESVGFNTESLKFDFVGETVTSDPYREMGRLIDSTTATKIEFGGDGINQRSIEEHLLARGLDSANVQKQSFNFEAAPLDNLRGESLEDLKDSPSNFAQEFQLNVTQENIPTVSPMKEMSFTSGGFNDREPSQENSSGLFSEQASDISSSLSKGTLEARETGEVFTSKLADAPKPSAKDSISSKIFNHAQMMFKNGGGSMRLDMEAPGIGKVDVAINLINNQLDVRIVTASEQARDMISKEVVGLRDGLSQQGISLRGLEVGKAGESSPRNFAGQGQQNFGQGAQDQRASYNDMREYAQTFKNSYAPRVDRAATNAAPSISRWSNSSIPSSGTGRLEVRV